MPDSPRLSQAALPQADHRPEVIDRIAPTRRPGQYAVMRQGWRELLFLHWAAPPELIRPLLPDSLEIDLFEGLAYVGLVPFTMTGVRPVGFPPVWGLSRFHETNVRTYVHLAGRDPGVWFFSLDAASAVAVRLARALYHLPYHHARMFLAREETGPDRSLPRLTYAGTRRRSETGSASYAIRAQVTGPVNPARPGTLEHFLLERYILYTRFQDRLYLGRVHHSPYPAQPAAVLAFDEDLLAAAGISRPQGIPMAHFAQGVDVDVFRLRCAHPSLT